jgi:hypothetical protein
MHRRAQSGGMSLLLYSTCDNDVIRTIVRELGVVAYGNQI